MTISWKRIAFGALTPAPLGVAILFLFARIMNQSSAYMGLADEARAFALFVVFAYIVCGLQSLLCSVLMEFVVNPKIQNNLYAAIIFIVLGGLSGSSVALVTFTKSTKMGIFVVLGALVGLITGMLTRFSYRDSWITGLNKNT